MRKNNVSKLVELLAEKNKEIEMLQHMLAKQTTVSFIAIILCVLILFIEPILKWIAL